MIKKLFLRHLLKLLDDPEIKKAIIKIITEAIILRNVRLRRAIGSLKNVSKHAF